MFQLSTITSSISNIDLRTFLDIANDVTRLKMYPYFDICHYILMCLIVREDILLVGANSAQNFSRKHPFACWLACFLTSFAGKLISNVLLGEPIILVFVNHRDILTFTAVWYVICYSPFDLVYKVVKFFPVKLIIGCLKEVQRAYKVYDGVIAAAKVYPHYYLVIVVIGMIKGCGDAIIKMVDRFIRGVWQINDNEFLFPSFMTKASLVAAGVFTAELYGWISASHPLVYLGVVAFFIYCKLSTLLIGKLDPFVPFENLFCAIFMGGMWDALKRAASTKRGSTSVVSEVRNGTMSKGSEEKKTD